MANFTTKLKVKRALGIPVTVTMHDDFLDYDVIPAVDAQIIAYTGMAGLTNTSWDF